MRFPQTLILLLSTCLSLSAQQKSQQNSDADQQDLQPLDNAIHHGILPNGMAYYVRKNQYPKKRAELYLVERAGSMQEDETQLGMAHFVEHMAFKGVRDFPQNQLIDYLQKSGIKFGADVNAHTGYTQTVFQLTTPTDSMQVFNKGLDILLNWAGYVNFDPAAVNSERNVILEEARLREKNAAERMENQTRSIEYNSSHFAVRLPIGSEEIIKNCTPEALKQFYHDWYRPDEQAIIVVGDISPGKIEEIIKEKFGVLQNPANEKPLVSYSIPPVNGTRVKVVTDPEAQYTEFSMVVRLPGTKDRTNTEYFQKMITILLNKMFNTRFSEIMKGGNPPFLYAGAVNLSSIGNTDVFAVRAIAKPGELEHAAKAVLAEVGRVKKFGFTNEELSEAKQWYLSGRSSAYADMANHTSGAYAQEYSRNFLDDEGCPGLEYEYNFASDNLKKIILPEINDLMALYTSDQNRTVIIKAPDREKANLPDEKTVLSWIDNDGSGLQAYKNVEVSANIDILPTDGLKSGKIESDPDDDVIGTQTLKLSNGATVILKNTNFRNGQVLFDIYGFGGTSITSDADFPSALLAGLLVRKSGVANFSQVELDKYLTNKKVGVSPYIHEYTQGINGGASAHDFELALKLIHLYFTAPRKDTTVWRGILSGQRAWLATKGNSPQSVFSDTVTAVLNNYNFRAAGLDERMLKSVNIDQAFNFYKDRFADASNFTFVFVGNLDDMGIRGLIKTYIGSLPSTHSNQTYKNIGMQPMAGKVTKVVRKGIDDKSTVELVFSGSFEYNQANNLQINALGEILQIKLIERLRQQESEVYSPKAGAYYSNYPTGRYTVTVQFTCSAANVDKLVAATQDEIDKIKQNGCLPADIEKFKAEETRSTQLKLKDNGFWLDHLASTSRNREDPDYIIDYTNSLGQVTVASTRAYANKYLSGDNFIKLILLPEKQ